MAKSVKCIDCGREIEYKTNPPKRCKQCKNKKAETSRKRREPQNGPSKWKKETKLFHILSQIFKQYESIFNGYYSWLLSPKGEPMQLDWYCPELRLAFEYQGSQHYIYSPYFHKSRKAFKYLQDCDKLKEDICKERSVILIAIKYDNNITEHYILTRLKESAPDIYKYLSLDK